MLWSKGKDKMRGTLRRPSKRYVMQKALFVYESLEIMFKPRNILLRNLNKKYFPHKARVDYL